MATELELSLKIQKKLDPQRAIFIVELTGTVDPESQLQALYDIYEAAQTEYLNQLLVLAPTDLTAYCEYIYPDEPPADWHVFMLNKLMELDEGFIPRLMISAPPGHAKSTYASRLFPTWRLGRKPRTQYLQAGHSQLFVENEFGKKCRDIVEDERYNDVFPGTMLSPASRAAGYWVLNNRSTYMTKGVGQGISGIRATLAGVDDPFASRADAESETIRNSTFDWFKADFMRRLLPRCPVFIVATRWHSDDLCGRLEAENNQIKKGLAEGVPWEIVNLPALAVDDPAEPDPMGRKPGEALWPEFYSRPILLDIKAELDSKNWNSLYMGKPTDVEGEAIKKEWFKEGRFKIGPKREDVRRRVMSVDTASKTNERSAYTVATIWDETKDDHHYLRHVYRKRMEFTEMSTTLNNLADGWDVDAVLVEDKGSGTQYIQQQADPNAARCPRPVIAIEVDNASKEFRMDGVTPMMQAGLVHLPENAPWLTDYENEIFAWPSVKWKDQGDSTSQYLSWARPKRKYGSKRMSGAGLGQHDRAREEIEEKIAEMHERFKQREASGEEMERDPNGIVLVPGRNYIGIAPRRTDSPDLVTITHDLTTPLPKKLQPSRRYGTRRLR